MDDTEKKPKKKMKDLGTRLLTAGGLAVFLLACMIPGGWFAYGCMFLLAGIALWEFYRAFGIEKEPVGILGYIVGAGYFIALGFNRIDFLLPILVLGFMLIMVGYCLAFHRTDAKMALTAFSGVMYAVVLMSYCYRVRMMQDGFWLILLAAVASFGCDSFAYFVGNLFGKHKLAPVLSPKKSVEGAVGAVILTGLMGAVYGWILKDVMTVFENPILVCGLIGFVGSLISIFGDLTASAFKRNQGVKDYSNILPGHGGILDRFDSMIFMATALFYIAKLFI